ncbi:MAG: hypothetical protein L6R40_008679 [Gallowayella cf. fulva]|nr:MAG: hypothetical protein L6R40_008679 [Xanthomendoza cf. fulva]
MKAHDISQQAAREASATPTKRQTGKAEETKAAAKKRKAAESDAGEDDKEATPKLKKVKEDPKAREIRQLDLFTKRRGIETSGKHDWKDVRVIGELKRSKWLLKKILILLARYIRLALNSGGVCGLSSLIVLKQLMETISQDSPPGPCDYFDKTGGTSTGGLVISFITSRL